MPKEFPLSKVYQLLEPGPVVLLTTAHKGASNVMTMSWHTMLDFEPPLSLASQRRRHELLRCARDAPMRHRYPVGRVG